MDYTMKNIPTKINAGEWSGGHIQGIAVDTAAGFIYYSFTTVFVKARLNGEVVGTVKGLTGHLGCISFNKEDGRVYGSLEYKHDSIGKGIMQNTGTALCDEDAFYIAIFDVDKITRADMDAEKDGVMTAVYLSEVVEDYNAQNDDGTPHRYGCSGVDGLAIGPVPGAADKKSVLLIAYGIYGALDRTDSDNQVILQYDWREFEGFARPLSQLSPHHSGTKAQARYFLFTGNTTWGIQNLEYDAFTGDYIAAVYRGKKPEYPNYPMFIIDGSKSPEQRAVAGHTGKSGLTLTLKKTGTSNADGSIHGLNFSRGQTGIYSFGNGYYYFSHEGKSVQPDGKKLHTSQIMLYKYDVSNNERFTPCSDPE